MISLFLLKIFSRSSDILNLEINKKKNPFDPHKKYQYLNSLTFLKIIITEILPLIC